jgi:hypothetical protein
VSSPPATPATPVTATTPVSPATPPALPAGAPCAGASDTTCSSGLVCKACNGGGNQCTDPARCCGGCPGSQTCNNGTCGCTAQQIDCGGGLCIANGANACCPATPACSAARPFCDSRDNTCKECLQNGQCTSGPAGTSGTCTNDTCRYSCNQQAGFKDCGNTRCVAAGGCCSDNECGPCSSCSAGTCRPLAAGQPDRCPGCRTFAMASSAASPSRVWAKAADRPPRSYAGQLYRGTVLSRHLPAGVSRGRNLQLPCRRQLSERKLPLPQWLGVYGKCGLRWERLHAMVFGFRLGRVRHRCERLCPTVDRTHVRARRTQWRPDLGAQFRPERRRLLRRQPAGADLRAMRTMKVTRGQCPLGRSSTPSR